MDFPGFPKGSEPRAGTSADRGKLVPWPRPPQPGARPFFRRLGPGLVTGVADVDPALVLTASVAGALFGYSLLWVVVLCVPFLLAIFKVAARIGHQTRSGLVDLLRRNYGRTPAIACALLLVVINMGMIVADLMAVTDALAIILEQPRTVFVAAVAFSVWYVLIFRDYQKITRVLMWLSLPVFAYIGAAILSRPDPVEVLRSSLLPGISGDPQYGRTVVALIGALLTPYVIVWQTSSWREQAASGQQAPGGEHRMGTLVTTLLCFSIMIAAGSQLSVTTPRDLTTTMAAEMLRPVAGELGPLLFALGIVGAGMVALPVLVASLCYSVSEAFGWRSGLSENPWEARGFYVLISSSLFLGATGNFFDVNPVRVLYWSQILAGVLAIPILIFILVVSNDRRIMQSTNTRWENIWVGAAAGALAMGGVAMVVTPWLR